MIALLLAILPGLGHMYLGYKGRGIMFAGLVPTLIYAGTMLPGMSLIMVIGAIALHVLAFIDVTTLIKAARFGVNMHRDPDLAFTLSFLLPGLGQIYNGQALKAVLCLFGGPLGTAAVYWLTGQEAGYAVWTMLLILPFTYAFSLFDAVITALDLSEEYGY